MAEVGPTMIKRRGFVNLWVTAREAFWLALETLRVHKLRSFLTLLGVVIATTTLISVMSIVNGMNLYIAERIANLGSNVFIIHQWQWAQGYESWLKARRRNKPVRMEEYEFLKENLANYKSIGAEAGIWGETDARYKGRILYDVEPERHDPQHDRHWAGEGGDRPLHHRVGLRPQRDGVLYWPRSRGRLLPHGGPSRQRSHGARHSLPGHRRGRAHRHHLRPESGQVRADPADHLPEDFSWRGRSSR